MELKNLKKKLYNKKPLEQRDYYPEKFIPGKEPEEIKLEEWEKTGNQNIFKKTKRKIFWSIFAVLSALVVLAAAGVFFYQFYFSFDKSQVKILISGPLNALSGDEITYTVKCENQSKVNLTNAKLYFWFPENSLPSDENGDLRIIDLQDIPKNSQKQLEFKAKIFGSKGEKKIAKAKLIYKPLHISSLFENESEFETSIIEVPLILDFDLPEKLVSGQEIRFSLEYINQSQASFDSLKIKIVYPSGFHFKSSAPLPSEGDNIWRIGDLNANESGKIFIQGTIKGNIDEPKPFQARIGEEKEEKFIVYSQTTESSRISSPPLSIKQFANNKVEYVAEEGEILDYRIEYKNTCDVGIKNVIITCELKGKALDFSSLKLEKGSFSEQTHTITWGPSDISDLELLAPGKSGEVKFSIKVKKPLPVFSYNDKNFKVVSIVKIDTLSPPLVLSDIQIGSENEIITRIKTKLVLEAKGYFRNSLISNNGPIPPRVGEKTTYTIVWQVLNSSNDLTETKVEAKLPSYINWTGNLEPDNQDIRYDPITRKVTWYIGYLPAGTGIITPVRQVAFQIGLIPSLYQVGDLVKLIEESKAVGKDYFVNEKIQAKDKEIYTDLPDDDTISRRDGKVVR